MPDAELALRAWGFCGGWEPERIAYAAEYLDIADVDRLTALLAAIRDRVDTWHDAQRKAGDAAHGA